MPPEAAQGEKTVNPRETNKQLKGEINMKKNKNLLNEKLADQAAEAAAQAAEALPNELLDQVSGAGDPFANIPRVPTMPIDDDLREDG
jgi:hypothetical protein